MFELQLLPNIGIAIDKVPSQVMEALKLEIAEISQYGGDPMNQSLVGHINQEYKLRKSVSDLETVIMPMAMTYLMENNLLDRIPNNKNLPLFLGEPWVNLQKKNEFNPIHRHKGVLSYVIWVKIPYELDEEDNMFSKVENPKTSRFEFQYTNILGTIMAQSVDIDKNSEGTICMFPAELSHCVYPFYTSDDYRITVSGNVLLKAD
jgi:hypothetical protein